MLIGLLALIMSDAAIQSSGRVFGQAADTNTAKSANTQPDKPLPNVPNTVVDRDQLLFYLINQKRLNDRRTPRQRCIDEQAAELDRAPSHLDQSIINLKCSQR